MKVYKDFGECFNEENHECVTKEEFLLGDFPKYINNNSNDLNDLEITEKVETFLHYTLSATAFENFERDHVCNKYCFKTWTESVIGQQLYS